MLRPLRMLLSALCFLIFFAGSFLLGVVFCPLLWIVTLGRADVARRICTRFIGRGYGSFILCLKLMGLIAVTPRIAVPPELEGRSYVVVANHPTLIDVIFLLNWFPGLTCVVKKSWYDFFFWGPLLRSTHYLPNADEGDGVDGCELQGAGTLERMVDHVKAGHPLAIFPEGTRSLATSLHRFKRGAFEIAERAGVPLVQVFVEVDRPFLMKGVPFWKTASGRAHYRLELLEVTEPSTDGEQGRQRRNEAQRRYEERFQASLHRRAIRDLPSDAESVHESSPEPTH